MRVQIVGGGPAGLCFAALMKLRDPSHQITVYERNRANDTFGWGVVFSDKTLDNLAAVDPVLAERIVSEFFHWDDIDIHFRGTRTRVGGHGFVGIGRLRLLQLQAERAAELGVELRYETEIDSITQLREESDLVIAADGLNSMVRERNSILFTPEIDLRKNKFIWLGTRKLFDAFTFIFIETEHGWIQAHAYRFSDELSTFIVEAPEPTWQAVGGEALTGAQSIELCQTLFGDYLDGHSLMSNAQHRRGREWITFPRVRNKRWHHETVVLLGDAAHTAHFSIGSGTKLGLEDAIELTEQLHRHDDMARALESYEVARRVDVERLQAAAERSTEWFETVHRRAALAPPQFCYSLLTRSQRISHDSLRQRDPGWLGSYEDWFEDNRLSLRGTVISDRTSAELLFHEIAGSHRDRLEALAAAPTSNPENLPVAVCVSAADWATDSDMLASCTQYKELGADLISVDSAVASEAIRNALAIATRLIGVSDPEHARTVLYAGRADLCPVLTPEQSR